MGWALKTLRAFFYEFSPRGVHADKNEFKTCTENATARSKDCTGHLLTGFCVPIPRQEHLLTRQTKRQYRRQKRLHRSLVGARAGARAGTRARARARGHVRGGARGNAQKNEKQSASAARAIAGEGGQTMSETSRKRSKTSRKRCPEGSATKGHGRIADCQIA